MIQSIYFVFFNYFDVSTPIDRLVVKELTDSLFDTVLYLELGKPCTVRRTILDGCKALLACLLLLMEQQDSWSCSLRLGYNLHNLTYIMHFSNPCDQIP